MCGISGIVAPNAKRYLSRSKKMASSLAHRGPDGTNIEIFENCILSQNALRIIDLTETGKQPMHSKTSGACVTFNGEIYGYKEIKEKLNYKFVTSSDTEVILALYDLFEEASVKKLPGMFAFAIWDDKKQKLFCARDRFGEKPFFYSFGPAGEFIFASEIKAILASRLVNPILDLNSVSHYLKYLYVPPNKTIYKNIFVLPPGHSLTFQKTKIEIQKYWQLPPEDGQISLSDAVSEFRELLDSSVKKQLISDVPLGVFLSGGLDSSTIVAIASKYKTHLKTFSLGFEEGRDELPYAKEVAKKFETDHKILTPPKTEIAELFIKMQEIYDEPFADSSNIPTYILSKLARKEVTVALSGDGGDELLGGYSHYLPVSKMDDVSLLFNLLSNLKMPFPKSVRTYIKAADYKKNFSSKIEAHEHQRSYFSNIDLINLQLQSVPAQKESDMLKWDIKSYLPGDILVKTDRASMSNSLEIRSPFLDKDVAEFCLKLPLNLKLSKTKDKLLLREAFEKSWPKSVRTRGKLGFGAPVSKWLKLPKMQILKKEYLKNKNKKIFTLFPYDTIQQYIMEDNYQTWIMLTFSVWLEKHDYSVASRF